MSNLSILQNTIGFLSFWGIIICTVISFSRGWKTWHPYFPLVGTLLFIINEIALSSSKVEIIRVDLAITVPMLVFLWLNAIVQVGMMKYKKLDIYLHNASSSKQHSTLDSIQILLALLIILAFCVFLPT
jgi:hypothetical protein